MRSSLAALPASKIREVANAGLGRPDVLAFWFGESDEVTPPEVREAAAASLARGETFYSHNLGLPELREGLSHYISALHAPVGVERIAVTSAGVSALMVAAQLLLSAGDEAVAVVPVWPNITAQPEILGAKVKRVALHPQRGAWRLDLQELLDAITPATRALLVNAPNNPTGWTLSRAEQQALLAHCRRTGTWIVADEVYERLWWGQGDEPGAEAGPAAPSFLDIAAREDRLIVTQSFSKSFLMTGWRLGWLVLPADPRGQALEAAGKLLEFNNSCAPVFIQRGALQALALAEDFVPGLVARLKAGRDTLLDGLARLPGIEVAAPAGGMYAFFRVEGQDDSLALAKRLVTEHGLGLAPGAAFGAEGEGWLRWCFASKDLARLGLGVQRLAGALGL
ncbi:pyridoxal phosphate-dependent aminotransferase [Azohydromonas sp. G-1-1-14]|uniref:Aminotransferase n=1 Tax=Azohydromonas caseinilytica TaxID=2728836 RepID=A0A848F3G7_9BURK|nr:pyridoxal phosphate-dependent aminotransferase [Azohydromonas caseinilytica]NML14617.1 pyridoxal phosphate-dependent aminotransferase [Azohydromonas caseinilytica]